MAKLIDTVRPGDKVTITTPRGQERTGRAVMRSSHGGWVLNMGGKHGTPGIADDRNVVRVSKGKRGSGALGSSAAVHTAEAHKATVAIEHAAAVLTNKARHGQCTAATLAYADMQRAIGHYEAHTRSGGKAWKPTTTIREAAFEYNDRCVRASTAPISGRRRKARR